MALSPALTQKPNSPTKAPPFMLLLTETDLLDAAYENSRPPVPDLHLVGRLEGDEEGDEGGWWLRKLDGWLQL